MTIKKIIFNTLKYLGAAFLVITFLLGVVDLVINNSTVHTILDSSTSADKRHIANYVNHDWDFYSVNIVTKNKNALDDRDEYEVYGGTEEPDLELQWINNKHLHIIIDYEEKGLSKRNELEKRAILEREYYKNKWTNPKDPNDEVEISYTRKNLSLELEKEFPIKFTDSPYRKRPTFELVKDFWIEIFNYIKESFLKL